MANNETSSEKINSSNTHDYFRGISVTLIFLFTLAAFASKTMVPRIACVGAAGLTTAIAMAVGCKKTKSSK